MKGFTLNAAGIVGFIVAMVTMLIGNDSLHFTPGLIHFFGIIVAIGTILLKTPWFVSEDWKGGSWTYTVWVVNGLYLAITILTTLTDGGLMSASVGTILVFTLNAIILYFGKSDTAKLN